jgi:F-type H+-transporting ATPase subunit epsilon
MKLKVLLPFKIFAEVSEVTRIVAETQAGFFGVLPQRLDCVAALVPGILTYETDPGGEVFLAIDAGILVKTGDEVRISVRRALGGADLGELRHLVESEFLALDAGELSTRTVMAKLETGFLRRLASFQDE